MYDPVFFYQGGDNADSYKRICLLPLTNLYFVPVYSGPSMCPSSVDWDNFKFTFYRFQECNQNEQQRHAVLIFR